MSLQTRLRDACWRLRSKSMPLSNFIPLLQEAADLLDDYEEVQTDHRRLVRELDVALNGEESAAKQASLCDVVHQVSEAMRVASQKELKVSDNVSGRWNVDFDGDDLVVCFNGHEKGEKCDYERYVEARKVDVERERCARICDWWARNGDRDVNSAEIAAVQIRTDVPAATDSDSRRIAIALDDGLNPSATTVNAEGLPAKGAAR